MSAPVNPVVMPAMCVEIDIGGETDLADVNFENLQPAGVVGPVDQHLAIEAAGAQQRRVEDFRPVRRGEQNDARTRIEAVELRQQLIERLLLFVIAAEAAGAAASGRGHRARR